MNNLRRLIMAVFIFLIILGAASASEITQVKKLFFSEVFIDKNEPLNNWVELYNPTNETIILHRFRISNILSLDCLPQEIRSAGGLSVPPGGFVVICADRKSFDKQWSLKTDPLVVETLRHLGKNGYISAITKKSGEMIYDMVLYGDHKNAYLKQFPRFQLLSFVENGNSYTREFTITKETVIISDFCESETSPGK